eukprot:1044251-Pyramimonas_sp.AAC.1
MQKDDYKADWLAHDAAIGCNLPFLPLAGGDTCTRDAAAARQKRHEELCCNLDALLASPKPRSKERHNIIAL